MLDWAPGPGAVLEWTQEWIQTLNKAEEDQDQAPKFKVASPNDVAHMRSDSCNSANKSILRNGYQKKRSVSWSKTIQVETFVKNESRDESQVSESESDESSYCERDELDLCPSKSIDNDVAETSDIDDVAKTRDIVPAGGGVVENRKPRAVVDAVARDRITGNAGARKQGGDSIPRKNPVDDAAARNRITGNAGSRKQGGDSIPRVRSISPTETEESEDVFAHLDVSFSGAAADDDVPTNEDALDLESVCSTITEITMDDAKAADAVAKSKPKPLSRQAVNPTSDVKPSSIFTPVLLPDNFRLENRLEIDENGSFCTLSEDDRSLISNMDDTVTLEPRRAASDDESIVSLRRRTKEYDDPKQREVDGKLGHLGLNLPLPSMKDIWSALGVSELGHIEALSIGMVQSKVQSKTGGGGNEVHETASISEACSTSEAPSAASEDIHDRYSTEEEEEEDGSEALSDVATLSRDVSMVSLSMSQDELGSLWHNKNAEKKKKKKKKPRFGRFSLSRRKERSDDDYYHGMPRNDVPNNKRRGLLKRLRKRSKAAEPQLLIC